MNLSTKNTFTVSSEMIGIFNVLDEKLLDVDGVVVNDYIHGLLGGNHTEGSSNWSNDYNQHRNVAVYKTIKSLVLDGSEPNLSFLNDRYGMKSIGESVGDVLRLLNIGLKDSRVPEEDIKKMNEYVSQKIFPNKTLS